MVYSPLGKPVTFDLTKLNAQKIAAYWFNPRSGKSKKIGEFSNTEKPEFTPWSSGRGSDFVLVVMDVNSSYLLPE